MPTRALALLVFLVASTSCSRRNPAVDAGRAHDAGADAGHPLDGGGTPSTLIGLSVSPALATLALGTQVSLTATGIFSSGVTQDLTTLAAWSSGAPNVATVAAGTVIAVAPGTTAIIASFGGQSASARITVSAASLTSLSITPATATTAIGGTVSFSATAALSDGTHQDVTGSAGWSSSSAAVSIAATGLAQALASGTATITATLGSLRATATLTIVQGSLASLAISPTNPTLGAGSSQQFTAIGTFTGGAIADMTRTCAWSSSDSSALAIAPSGLGTALQAGTSLVTASSAGVSATTTVTITSSPLAGIALLPAAATLVTGGIVNLSATGSYADGTHADLTQSVAWNSSAPTVAAVSNGPGTQGQVVGVGTGDATISATLGSISGSAAITVSPATLTALSIHPAGLSLPIGSSQPFTATGTYSDGTILDVTSNATWSIDGDGGLAIVSNAAGSAGLVTAEAAGVATLRARLGAQSATAQLTISLATLRSIAIVPATLAVTIGVRRALAATGTFSDGTTLDLTTAAIWTSSDATIAAVSNAPGAQGQLVATGAGSATITATLGNVAGSLSVTVAAPTLTTLTISPISPSLPAGQNLQFTAQAIDSSGATINVTRQAQWTSSNTGVATIGNLQRSSGVATLLGAGITTITAQYQGLSASMPLTVTSAVPTQIVLSPIDATVAAGVTIPYQATAIFSDFTSQQITFQAAWTSSNPAIAGIGNRGFSRGRATALSAGTTTITASWQGLTGSTTLTVSAALLVSMDVSPASSTLIAGDVRPLAAAAIYSDGTSHDVTGQATWISSAPAVAGVSDAMRSRGQVKAISAGSTTISATWQGVSGTALITVSSATITSIVIAPAQPQVAAGVPVRFSAAAILSDQTSQDVTSQATWTSSDAGIAAISDSFPGKGICQTLAPGSAVISATFGGTSGSTTITVSPATLSTIQVTPFAPRIPVGYRTPMQATGLYTDNSTQDLTFLATWSSSAPATAAVSDSNGTKGLLSPLAAGTATITASFQGMSGTDVVTVTNATLQSIAVNPATVTLAVQQTQQMTAIGTFSDTSSLDITDYVTWLSNAPAICAVSNAGITRGQAKALATGSATVSGVKSGVTGNATITVQ